MLLLALRSSSIVNVKRQYLLIVTISSFDFFEERVK